MRIWLTLNAINQFNVEKTIFQKIHHSFLKIWYSVYGSHSMWSGWTIDQYSNNLSHLRILIGSNWLVQVNNLFISCIWQNQYEPTFYEHQEWLKAQRQHILLQKWASLYWPITWHLIFIFSKSKCCSFMFISGPRISFLTA